MNYEPVYQTLKTKLEALIQNVAVRLPNEPPAKATDCDIDISVTEVDANFYTEEENRRDISIDLLISVPVSTGTERIHNIASQIVKEFNPLRFGCFWTGQREYYVRIQSAGQRRPNITHDFYQVNIRILAIIDI